MLVTIHSQGIELTDELREHANSKARLALGLYIDKIHRANIFLTDLNGPKGGEDMNCKIKLTIYGQAPIIVEETAVNIGDAINICSHKVKRTLSRRFERTYKNKRYPTLKRSAIEEKMSIQTS